MGSSREPHLCGEIGVSADNTEVWGNCMSGCLLTSLFARNYLEPDDRDVTEQSPLHTTTATSQPDLRHFRTGGVARKVGGACVKQFGQRELERLLTGKYPNLTPCRTLATVSTPVTWHNRRNSWSSCQQRTQTRQLVSMPIKRACSLVESLIPGAPVARLGIFFMCLVCLQALELGGYLNTPDRLRKPPG